MTLDNIFLLRSILIPVLPFYAIYFGAGAFELGIIMAIFSGAAVVGTYVAGALSDKYGRKPLIVISIGGTGIPFSRCVSPLC